MENKEKEKTCVWSIAADNYTNQIVTMYFAADMRVETNWREGVKCWDKKGRKYTKRNVWDLEYRFIAPFLSKAGKENIKVKMFRQELPNGKTLEFNPNLFSQKRKVVRQAEKELARKLQSRT